MKEQRITQLIQARQETKSSTRAQESKHAERQRIEK